MCVLCTEIHFCTLLDSIRQCFFFTPECISNLTEQGSLNSELKIKFRIDQINRQLSPYILQNLYEHHFIFGIASMCGLEG
jgi:hypothetical protein